MRSNAESGRSPVRMRRDLAGRLGAPRWPAGVALKEFVPARAPELHTLLDCAYASGGGSVPEFAEWWSRLAADAEFDPTLCVLAQDDNGRIVGAAQCWTSAFVKDLAVHPDWRRRGIGRALLLHVFVVFQRRGAAAVDLKVNAGNAAAIALYESLGMRAVPLGAGQVPSPRLRGEG